MPIRRQYRLPAAHDPGNDRPGGSVRLVQPLNEHVAFTAEAGLNETFLNAKDSGRVVFGIQMGNYIHPKEYAKIKTPVPMDVPRVRYERLTRRVGNSPPVANAGPDQTTSRPAPSPWTVRARTIRMATDHLRWTQICGATVTLASPTSANATFTAAPGQTYVFRLTVTDSAACLLRHYPRHGGSPDGALVVRVRATPSNIAAGQNSS